MSNKYKWDPYINNLDNWAPIELPKSERMAMVFKINEDNKNNLNTVDKSMKRAISRIRSIRNFSSEKSNEISTPKEIQNNPEKQFKRIDDSKLGSISLVAIKVRNNNSKAIESLIEMLTEARLKPNVVPSVRSMKEKKNVNLFSAEDSKVLFILLNMNDSDIRWEAEIQKYQMEIYGSYSKIEYKVRLSERFKPFRGQHKQEIIANLLNRAIDIELFKTIGVVLNILYLHNPYYYNKKVRSLKRGCSKYIYYLK